MGQDSLIAARFQRWIATPWWNLRFSLGRWIGGFDHVSRNYYYATIYANKRWGHGRLTQFQKRLVCHARGHRWSPWSENARVCRSGCGGVQTGGGDDYGREQWEPDPVNPTTDFGI